MNFYKSLILIMLFTSFFLNATEFGPNVSKMDGQDLKWEGGAQDYFVMFKTLLKNDNRTQCTPMVNSQCELGDDQNGNPQADACIDQETGSTFELKNNHIPKDAVITDAYLIWMSALPSEKIPDGETDNKVKLSFEGNNEATLSKEITATETAKTLNDNYDFKFAAVENVGKVGVECTSDEDCINHDQLGEGWTCVDLTCATHTVVYTYRADVTDFFKNIYYNSETYNSNVFLGKYTVSQMECTNDPAYLTTSAMVGGWALVLIYSSEKISPKNIYIYDGFESSRFSENIISTSGFKLPGDALVKFTVISAEGDPNLATSSNPDEPLAPAPPEGLSISGEQKFQNGDWLLLWNKCNPAKSEDSNGLSYYYTEVFNSISSNYGWEASEPECIGGEPGQPNPDLLEYTMDVDTFIISSEDSVFESHLEKDSSQLNFKIGTNQDMIYTNLMIIAIDTLSLRYDIPEKQDNPSGRELNYCSCSEKADSICLDRPFYFTIQIENHSENLAENVTVKNELPENVEYIPGSTEIIKTVSGKLGKWEKIPDIDGKFPLEKEYKVMDAMSYCDEKTHECQDSVFIRYKVDISNDLDQFEIIKNTAVINDDSEVLYETNKSIPLKLYQDSSCPSLETCPEPLTENCGPQESEDNSDTGNTGDTGDTGNTGNSGNSGSSNTNEEDDDSNSGESSCSVIII